MKLLPVINNAATDINIPKLFLKLLHYPSLLNKYITYQHKIQTSLCKHHQYNFLN